MPWRCVAAQCSNTPAQGVSLHCWPTPLQQEQADLWLHFVQATRDGWTPSESSRLCSAHFVDSCFTNYLKYTLGHSERLILRSDAVPTIYIDIAERRACSEPTTSTPTTRADTRETMVTPSTTFTSTTAPYTQIPARVTRMANRSRKINRVNFMLAIMCMYNMYVHVLHVGPMFIFPEIQHTVVEECLQGNNLENSWLWL